RRVSCATPVDVTALLPLPDALPSSAAGRVRGPARGPGGATAGPQARQAAAGAAHDHAGPARRRGPRAAAAAPARRRLAGPVVIADRKSTRLNSSYVEIS